MNQLVTGKFISLKRKEKNLTQAQLAEKLGVSNKTVSKWETGKCMPDYSIVKCLCEERCKFRTLHARNRTCTACNELF